MTDRHATPYTEAVLMEVMRCGSPTPVAIGHRTTEETELGKTLIVTY